LIHEKGGKDEQHPQHGDSFNTVSSKTETATQNNKRSETAPAVEKLVST
jgi:hypothetical protein